MCRMFALRNAACLSACVLTDAEQFLERLNTDNPARRAP